MRDKRSLIRTAGIWLVIIGFIVVSGMVVIQLLAAYPPGQSTTTTTGSQTSPGLTDQQYCQALVQQGYQYQQLPVFCDQYYQSATTTAATSAQSSVQSSTSQAWTSTCDPNDRNNFFYCPPRLSLLNTTILGIPLVLLLLCIGVGAALVLGVILLHTHHKKKRKS